MRGYLVYEQADAQINKGFIQMLQEEAHKQKIVLELVFSEALSQHDNAVDFVWNRSRNASVAKRFEALGIRVFNNSHTNKIANNKQLASAFVQRLGIQTVPTYSSITEIATYPVVFKTVDGHGGQEVMLCHNATELTKVLSEFKGRQTIIQPYIESNAQDVRVWLLGSKVIGAVLRSGTNDFKSNYTLGGSIAKFDLPASLKHAVQTITAALQSDYIGIDFLKAADGTFYFNELEDPVGAKSYYELFNDQLAVYLIHYIKSTINSK